MLERQTLQYRSLHSAADNLFSLKWIYNISLAFLSRTRRDGMCRGLWQADSSFDSRSVVWEGGKSARLMKTLLPKWKRRRPSINIIVRSTWGFSLRFHSYLTQFSFSEIVFPSRKDFLGEKALAVFIDTFTNINLPRTTHVRSDVKLENGF